MKPGRELDKLVAEAMGWKRVDDCPLGDSFCPGKYLTPEGERWCCLPFSTEAAPAMQAWEWLERNNPWRPLSQSVGDIQLTRYYRTKEPAVIVLRTYCEEGVSPYEEVKDYPETNFAITGESYPHAICLAVLATKKAQLEQG